MGRLDIALSVLLVGTSSVAIADELSVAPAVTADEVAVLDATPLAPPTTSMMDRRWPSLPDDKGLTIEDRITDHLSELGNLIGARMNHISDHLLSLHVDGRRNRARLAFGGGNAHYLEFKVDSDWLFSDGKAHVAARVELGLMGHEIALKLPNMDLSRDSYAGQDMVTVNVSVLQRRF